MRRWLWLGLLGAGGCAAGPDFAPPDLATPPAYRGDLSLPQTTPAALWWAGFNDPALDSLIAQALEANAEIDQAQARLAQARALAWAETAGFFPRLDAAAEAQSEEGAEAASEARGLLSFAPDVFGGQRRRLERARAQARAQADALEDARRRIAAETARQYIALRRADTRLALLDNSLDLQRQTLEIVQQRLEVGLAAGLDLERAGVDVARTRAQRGALAIARARAENALSVLLGRPPADLVPPSQDPMQALAFSGGPATGIPADLVRRRPDIRAGEAELAAATAAIGIEAADLYPSLTLDGRITATLGGVDAIAGETVSLLGATLDLPLFDAGARRAQVRAARANAEAALAAYRQALLEGLRETENALAAIENLSARRVELARAVEASERAFRQLEALDREGLADFFEVLDSQRVLISNREAFVDSEADLAAAIVDLYEALGAPTEAPPLADAPRAG